MHSHLRAGRTCSGERHKNRLLRVDFDFPCVEPSLEDVKMKLEVL
jgi:hypothetical protein